jgi:hypothetical protein
MKCGNEGQQTRLSMVRDRSLSRDSISNRICKVSYLAGSSIDKLSELHFD